MYKGIIRVTILLVAVNLLQACETQKYKAEKYLTQSQYDTLLVKLAPFVNKKPKSATFSERFTPKYTSYYEACVKGQESSMPFFYSTDSIHYFYYVNKDLTSLYEHYKGFGGTFKKHKDGQIAGLNLVFTTPRLTKEEITEKGKELFIEMVKTGDVATYKGNRQYVHLPNADFEYNKAENRWVYTENSSWSFLKDIKGEEN